MKISIGSVSGIVSTVDGSPSSFIYTFAPTSKPIPSTIFTPSLLLGHLEALVAGQSDSSVVFLKYKSTLLPVMYPSLSADGSPAGSSGPAYGLP